MSVYQLPMPSDILINASKIDLLKILVVEDSEDEFVMLRDLLRDTDAGQFVIERADSYDGALEAMRAERHDLILLDFRLSNRTGLELLAETDSIVRRAPVILMTERSDDGIDARAMKLGAADYLVKDHLDAELMGRVIRYAVERRKSEEALEQSEDRYRMFVANSVEGISGFELERPPQANLTGAGMDISFCKEAEADRNRAEEALRLIEKRLRLALESGRFGTFNIDLKTGQYRELSDIARIQFAGLLPGNVSIGDFFRLVHPDDLVEVQGAVAKASAALEADFCSDYRIVLPSGDLRWISVQGTIDYDDAGLPISMIGVTQDISDQKRVEESLERTNREIVTSWESMTDAFFIVDHSWQFTYINSQGTLLLQKTSEYLVGLNIWEVFPEALDSTFFREYHRAFEEQVAVSFEEYYAPLGKWMEVHAYPSTVGLSVYFRDITDRKLAENVNREAEQEQRELATHLAIERARLAEAQAIAKVGSWELDLHSWEVIWSDETYRIYGCDRAKFDNSYSAVLEHIHFDDRAAVNEAFRDSLATHIPYTSDHRIVRDDGSIRFVHERCRTIYDDDGSPLRSIGTSQDITQQKESEQERDGIEESLRKSESRFREVVEKVESLVIHDKEGQLIDVNQNACDSLGYTRDELLRLSVRDYETNFEFESSNSLWEQMSSGKISTLVVDRLHRRKDGSTFPVEVRMGLMVTDGPLLMVEVARDVTDRKQAEEERDRFFTLSLDMLAIISADGYIKRLNPAFEATLGFSDAELMARPYLDFVHPDDIAATLVEAANLGSGLQTMRFENRYICRDGSYKWLRWMCAPFEDLWYCVAHDITAIKQAAKALHEANEELEARVEERTAQLQSSHQEMSIAKEEAERANVAKSEFLSRMSHELRTPMNSILGFAQIMELDAPQGKQAVRIGHILKAGQHLLQLINEVLDLARVESGRLQLSLERVSLGNCVQSAVDMIRPLCEQRGQRISCRISECGSLYVQADQQRLSQVLINVISNAAKYSSDGGEIKIKCEQHREGRQRVSISDSGAGIHPEQMEKLFRPFERLDAANGPIEGTGLGLALSKRLVELMGGWISVESVVGTGSTFSIELQEADFSSQEADKDTSLSALRYAGVELSQILYIEDSPANLSLVEDLFSNHPQYVLHSAQTALRGLEMSRNLNPSLILLDLHLPDLPGEEVLVRLQADPNTRSIPVVVVSADATSSQVARLLSAGATDYLTKPLDVRLFHDVLHRILLSQKKKVA